MVSHGPIISRQGCLLPYLLCWLLRAEVVRRFSALRQASPAQIMGIPAQRDLLASNVHGHRDSDKQSGCQSVFHRYLAISYAIVDNSRRDLVGSHQSEIESNIRCRYALNIYK